MRIGELARRTQIPADTLRKWERRYGILGAARSAGGHRQYSAEDVATVRALTALTGRGMSISVAVAHLRAHPTDGSATRTAALTAELQVAIDQLDPQRLWLLLHESFQSAGATAAIDDILVPILRDLGLGWRTDPAKIAREHFASSIIRSFLVEELTASPDGQLCVAFCPDGEQHDIPLLLAARSLADAGWLPLVLGAHTPLASARHILDSLRPKLVVISATTRRPALRLLDRWHPPPPGALIIAGGQGFRHTDAARLSAHLFQGPYRELNATVERARHPSVSTG